VQQLQVDRYFTEGEVYTHHNQQIKNEYLATKERYNTAYNARLLQAPLSQHMQPAKWNASINKDQSFSQYQAYQEMRKQQVQRKFFYQDFVNHLWRYWLRIYDHLNKKHNGDAALVWGEIDTNLGKIVDAMMVQPPKTGTNPQFTPD
jgi:hypothetical protein